MCNNFDNKIYFWWDWKKHPNILIIDYHDGPDHGMAYWEHLECWQKRTMNALKKAQKEGNEYVLFTHGSSTSRQGAQTARSVVRKIMRGKIGTPYIMRKKCIDYGAAFLAAIRPMKRDEQSEGKN